MSRKERAEQHCTKCYRSSHEQYFEGEGFVFDHEFSPKFDTRFQDSVFCPWCGEKNSDDDLKSGGLIECTECGRDFEVEIDYDPNYTTSPLTCYACEAKDGRDARDALPATGLRESRGHPMTAPAKPMTQEEGKMTEEERLREHWPAFCWHTPRCGNVSCMCCGYSSCQHCTCDAYRPCARRRCENAKYQHSRLYQAEFLPKLDHEYEAQP